VKSTKVIRKLKSTLSSEFEHGGINIDVIRMPSDAQRPIQITPSPADGKGTMMLPSEINAQSGPAQLLILLRCKA
jgi:hypothetical protein